MLTFSESSACDQAKYLFLNDQPCMVRSTLIDMNPVELKCDLFVISIDNCTGSLMSYLQRYVFQKKQNT